jgi:anti-sigma factor ChrR (cupin superfamily)
MGTREWETAMQHQGQTEEHSADLALYALGVLASEEAQIVAQRLNAHDTPSTAELRAVEQVVGLLGYSAPVASPPPTLKAKLLERVQAEAVAAARTPTGRSTIDVASLRWEPSAYSGVSLHWLRQDETTGTCTVFVKIAPGCKYTAHRHVGGEECLVLQGGFRDRRGEYHAGDFVYYEPGSIHHDFQALEGEECLLFVVAHGGLEMLPAEG